MSISSLPLVSVIIPAYNAQDWILGLLKSILNQTYENIEVIIVDDGSTDKTHEMISQFMQSIGGGAIRVISQKNLGVSVARNEGVRLSNGEIIAFVDSDDIWLPNKIEKQVSLLKNSSASAVACSYAIFRDWDLEVIDVVNPDWSYRGVCDWLLFRSYGGLLSSSLLIEKVVFYEVGQFRSELSLSADIEFAWRLLRITQVELISEPLVGYRLRPNQMHKLPDLLSSEAQRMLSIIDFLKLGKNRNVYLANLNLRICLYSFKECHYSSGFGFLLKALRENAGEVIMTSFRISLKRLKRKFGTKQRSLFILPRPTVSKEL